MEGYLDPSFPFFFFPTLVACILTFDLFPLGYVWSLTRNLHLRARKTPCYKYYFSVKKMLFGTVPSNIVYEIFKIFIAVLF